MFTGEQWKQTPLTSESAHMPTQILRLPAVKARTGLSRSTIYAQLAEGAFPRPIALGARAVGWVEKEIESWLAQRIKQSRARAA